MLTKRCLIQIRFIVLAVWVCFTTACADNNQANYFPLNKGAKWRYDVALTTRDGLEKQKYFLNSLGKKELADKAVFVKHSLDGSALYYSENEKGITYLGHVSDLNLGRIFKPDEQVIFPYPIEKDSRWQTVTETRLLKKTGPPQKTEFKIVARVPMDATVESLSETITVPAGTFENCLKIIKSGSTMKDAGNYVGLTMVNVEETSWYAPNIGLVKMQREETTQSAALDKGNLLIELADFEPG